MRARQSLDLDYANLEADEALDRRALFLDDLFDRLRAVLVVTLVRQHDFAVELVKLPFGDLLEDLFGLLRVLRIGLQAIGDDSRFARNSFGIHFRARQALRLG